MSSAFHHPCHSVIYVTEALLSSPNLSISRLCPTKWSQLMHKEQKVTQPNSTQSLDLHNLWDTIEWLLLEATKLWGSLLGINNNSFPSIVLMIILQEWLDRCSLHIYSIQQMDWWHKAGELVYTPQSTAMHNHSRATNTFWVKENRNYYRWCCQWRNWGSEKLHDLFGGFLK